MKQQNTPLITAVISISFCFTLLSYTALAKKPQNWKTKQVDLRLTGDQKIKAIHYPDAKPPIMLKEHRKNPKKPLLNKTRIKKRPSQYDTSVKTSQTIITDVIQSPPVDGFVPWISLAITDAHETDFVYSAQPTTTIDGDYLTNDPQSDYAIGIFDTGASASLISSIDAYNTGMYDASMVTSAEVILLGATGSAVAYTSKALGIYIDSIGAIEPNGLLMDNSNMVGETNISMIVGDPVLSPDIPTAIGAPLAIFYSAAFNNQNLVSTMYDSNTIIAPDIRFFEHDDPCVPAYTNKINLNLKPADVLSVEFFPCIEGLFECPDGDGSPMVPTIINDPWWLYQGLFFASSVDVTHDAKASIDKHLFMFDTGAQVTVLSEDIAARLLLPYSDPDPNNWDFAVEILDATGEITIAPGFYVDYFDITATPKWLSFTNVPVIILNVQYSGGGYLDGIIGMNLFNDMNFVFKGGGLLLQGQTAPYISFEHICRADIAPVPGDCYVDHQDLQAFSLAWTATEKPTPSPNWNPKADLAPQHLPDGKIDMLDYAVLAGYWMKQQIP